ncbi:hypothetical protein [Flavobacterium pectinovorum]|uniref:Lipoprotein n=1 Tax=Flavobacterium pectinovorum TaxID=29533 RepID=A0A502EYM6_9FLAO|nr:hypothetical protein [Flavobacterium pectinovorum]TPG41690.1 hypothetical protein EAH81_09425 [Flavobacterium pectinovorum]
MKKYFILFFVLFSIFSCSNKTQSTIENLIDNFSFNRTISNSSTIIIKLYDTAVTKKRVSDVESFTPKKEFKALNRKQIEAFNEVFTNAEKTGYCCCSTAIYSIRFLNQKEELDLFYVDTLEFKDKVRIYEDGFQYSYIVDKENWKDYLSEIKN